MPRIRPGPGRRSGWERRREPDVTDRHDGRIGFGNRLRRLREDAELSGKQLAERLEWPASKVSRLENGRQTATADDVRAWTTATGTPGAVLDDLVEDLRSLRVEYANWTRQLRGGMAPRQRVSGVLEDGTTVLRDLQTVVVPGLLQTAEYARELIRALAGLYPHRDVDAAVHERTRRQEVLYQPGRDFRFLLTESALRTRFGTGATHRGQLDRLLVLAGLDTVRIGMLPTAAPLPRPVAHGFVVYDDRLVMVETINADMAIRDADDVALYLRVFDELWDAAVHGEDAARFIAATARDLPA